MRKYFRRALFSAREARVLGTAKNRLISLSIIKRMTLKFLQCFLHSRQRGLIVMKLRLRLMQPNERQSALLIWSDRMHRK